MAAWFWHLPLIPALRGQRQADLSEKRKEENRKKEKRKEKKRTIGFLPSEFLGPKVTLSVIDS